MKKEFDPRMHSAEHLLNQTMDRMFGCGRCFRAHIERKKSKCDYRYHRNLNDDERDEIEQRVNTAINDDLPVKETFKSRAEAEKEIDLDRLPSDAGDTVRIVEMGDYDACACIGPHVDSTKMIGAFRITSTSFDDGVLRIRFKLSAP